MLDSTLRVADCRTEAGFGSMWIGLQQFRYRSALTELAQDEFTSNAGAADHGLAKHHRQVDIDSIIGSARMARLSIADRVPQDFATLTADLGT